MKGKYFNASKAGAWTLLISAGFVLTCWTFWPSLLHGHQPNYLGCNPLTAMSFFIMGCGLLFIVKDHTRSPFLALTSLLLLIIVSGQLFHFTDKTGRTPDQWFFTERLQGARFSSPTATCFLLSATAMLWYSLSRSRAVRWGHLIILPLSCIVLFSLLGFLLSDELVRESYIFAPMSLITTILFGITAATLCYLFRNNPLSVILSSRELGGFTARRLLPYLLIVPVFVFILGGVLKSKGLISYGISNSAQISILFFILLLVVTKLASVINAIDRAERESKRQLEQKSIQLAAINAELERFSFAASHDLQEPLRKIAVFADRLQSTGLSNDQDIYIDKISRTAERGSTLISDILRYSRSIHHEDAFEKTALSDILEDVIIDFEAAIAAAQATVRRGKLPALDAVPFQMTQLFSNLLSNAVKFARPGVPLEISIFAQQQPAVPESGTTREITWEICFQDNGLGFDQQYADRVFDVFQRLHGKTIAGSGIGLSLCRNIVEAHGGKLRVNSKAGEGSCFIFSLPERRKE